LNGLGQHPAVACISTLQHIPGRENRARLLREMGERLEPQGVLFLANWQFADRDRQRRKIMNWAEVDIAEADVEENDYLLTWERGARGRRYVSLIDDKETARLAEVAGLIVIDQFRSDGREGDLNLYSVLRHDAGPPAE
jgi:SAM-dependent methyltransferase